MLYDKQAASAVRKRVDPWTLNPCWVQDESRLRIRCVCVVASERRSGERERASDDARAAREPRSLDARLRSHTGRRYLPYEGKVVLARVDRRMTPGEATK